MAREESPRPQRPPGDGRPFSGGRSPGGSPRREPFSFLHADGLALGAPPRGLADIDEDLRSVAIGCTQIAFDNLIAACCERQPDFLLLTGNSLYVGDPESDDAFWSQAALVDGLRRLDEAGIPVYVSPGDAQTRAAWDPDLALPPNVVWLGDDVEAETAADAGRNAPRLNRPPCIAVERDGRVLATIRCLPAEFDAEAPDEIRVCFADGSEACPPELDDAVALAVLTVGPFRGGLNPGATVGTDRPMAYAAVEGVGGREARSPSETWPAGRRRTVWNLAGGVAHAPGGTQGLAPGQTGPHGATWVSIDAAGRAHLEPIPTAPLRFERIEVPVANDSAPEQIVARMVEGLRRIERCSTDRVWLVRWLFDGAGPLWEQLHHPDLVQRLADEAIAWHQSSDSHAAPEILVRSLGGVGRPRGEGGPYRNWLAGHYLQLAERRLAQRSSPGAGTESGLAEAPWHALAEPLLEDVDEDDLASRIRRRGLAAFPADEGARSAARISN